MTVGWFQTVYVACRVQSRGGLWILGVPGFHPVGYISPSKDNQFLLKPLACHPSSWYLPANPRLYMIKLMNCPFLTHAQCRNGAQPLTLPKCFRYSTFDKHQSRGEVGEGLPSSTTPIDSLLPVQHRLREAGCFFLLIIPEYTMDASYMCDKPTVQTVLIYKPIPSHL